MAPCNPIRTCMEHSPVEHYRKERAPANTQEETGQDNADEVVGDPNQDRDKAPEDHTDGEVY